MSLVPLLKKSALFADLSEEELSGIGQRMIAEIYDPGEIILEEDGDPRGFFVIISGSALVYKDYNSYLERCIATLPAGAYFGEMSVLDDSPDSCPNASIVAETDVVCMLLKRDVFHEMNVFFKPSISRKFIRNLINIVRKREEETSREFVQAQEGIIISLAKLAEFRDPETGAHLERIQGYSRLLAEAASAHPAYAGEINDDFIAMIYASSPLHDIGKVGIPDQVLLKPDKLTDEEFEIMKQHPLIGAEAIKQAMERMELKVHSFLLMGHDIALGHHERVDGTGYPFGKRGGEIPLSARIVAIADVYDALRSDRVYRDKQFTHEEARALIEEGRDKQFEPDLVEIFFSREDELHAIWERY